MSKRFPGWNSPEAEIDAWIEAKYPGHYERKAEVASETGLWDRLRADLNNLGAAYGPLETPQGPLTPFGEALQSLSHGLSGVATNKRSDSEPVEIWLTRTITEDEARERYPDAPTPVDNLSPTDRNAYFDGIILAARMKRIRANHNDQCDRDIARNWDGWQAELDRSQMLEAAMSRPLDWEPRVGHKGVEIDE